MRKTYLGLLVISPTGLRRMANWLQRKKNRKGDIKVKGFVCEYTKVNRTFGIELSKGDK